VPFASAITCSSAIIGPIFPPSIPLIIYGTVTGASVLQLLLGGIVPGLLCTVALMAMAAWLAKRRGYPRAERWPTRGEVVRDMLPAIPALLAPVILIVGMLAGFFTPIEIASATVAYTIAISALFYRKLTLKDLMIGLVTPPMGLALYLVSDIAKVSMKDVLREMLPFYVPLVATLLAITYIPWLTTWLPRLAIGP
jgi:TRAP-type C4-dicarboxylate transport system permease large subunit